MNARPIAVTALAVLAAGQLIAYGVLSGQPNAGLMAVAVLPCSPLVYCGQRAAGAW